MEVMKMKSSWNKCLGMTGSIWVTIIPISLIYEGNPPQSIQKLEVPQWERLKHFTQNWSAIDAVGCCWLDLSCFRQRTWPLHLLPQYLDVAWSSWSRRAAYAAWLRIACSDSSCQTLCIWLHLLDNMVQLHGLIRKKLNLGSRDV